MLAGKEGADHLADRPAAFATAAGDVVGAQGGPALEWAFSIAPWNPRASRRRLVQLMTPSLPFVDETNRILHQ